MHWPADTRSLALRNIRYRSSYVKRLAFPGAYDDRPKTKVEFGVEQTYEDGGDSRQLIVVEPDTPVDRVLIYSHGNFERAADNGRYLRDLAAQLGCVAVGFEYPGYNYEPGEPTPPAINQALASAMTHLQAAYPWPEYKYAVMGYSIGTGPTAFLASCKEYRDRIDCCVLVAPYKSLLSVAGAFGNEELKDRGWSAAGHATDQLASNVARLCRRVVPGLCGQWWSTVLNVQSLACPLLVVHGPDDEVIPYSHGQEIAASAQDHGVTVQLHTLPRRMGHTMTLAQKLHHVIAPTKQLFDRVWPPAGGAAAAAGGRPATKKQKLQQASTDTDPAKSEQKKG